MTIADNIKRLREQHNLTQDQLAEIAGVSDKAVSSWEQGNSTPRMGAIQKIADHFGILKSQIIEEDNLDYIPLSSIIYKLISTGGYTNEEVAEKLGVTADVIIQWMYGRSTPNKKQYNDLAKLYGISTSYFVTGKKEDKIFDYETFKKNFLSGKFPLYGSISAGQPLEMLPIEEYVEVPPTIAGQYPNAFLLRINGDSMSKIIPSGAFALINPYNGEDIFSGDVVVVQVNGYEATLKRFFKLQNTIVLEPDSYSEEHKPQMYSQIEAESIRIIGKMVWFMAPINAKF